MKEEHEENTWEGIDSYGCQSMFCLMWGFLQYLLITMISHLNRVVGVVPMLPWSSGEGMPLIWLKPSKQVWQQMVTGPSL